MLKGMETGPPHVRNMMLERRRGEFLSLYHRILVSDHDLSLAGFFDGLQDLWSSLKHNLHRTPYCTFNLLVSLARVLSANTAIGKSLKSAPVLAEIRGGQFGGARPIARQTLSMIN